jgi:hypothetical protein
MSYEPFETLAAMLSPEAMSALESRPVTGVASWPWVPIGSASSCPFLRVETSGPMSGNRYIVKRMSPTWDVIMRITGDSVNRERLLWQYGVFDRLPPEIYHPIVACAADDDGWAILMRDVSETLMPDDGWWNDSVNEVSNRTLYCMVDGLAALHARFWNEPSLDAMASGLCTPATRYVTFSTHNVRREDASVYDFIGIVRQGWDVLDELVAPDVAGAVRDLLRDPVPLCAALARFPSTLVHGDPRCPNIGVTSDPAPRLVLLDWHMVGREPPAVDLTWFLTWFSRFLPCTKEEAIAMYRDALAYRLGDGVDHRWWQPQLELAMLGQYLRMGWFWLYWLTHPVSDGVRDALRRELDWWTDGARAGLRQL